MKLQSFQKLIAFIITIMMFSVIPELVNAQRKCPQGQFLSCDQDGKHCKCIPAPRPPCRACGLFANLQSATISFSLDKPEKISAKIFDATGRLIKTLADTRMPGGDHQIEWNKRDEAGNTVSPGIYIVQFDTGTYSGTKKFVVIN